MINKSHYNKGILKRAGKRQVRAQLKAKQKEFALPKNHILVKIWTGLLNEGFRTTSTAGLSAEQLTQFLRAYWNLWDYQEKRMTMTDKMQLQAQLKEHFKRRHVEMRGEISARRVSRWDKFQSATNNILHNCQNVEIMKHNTGYGICKIHDASRDWDKAGKIIGIAIKTESLSKSVRILGMNCDENCWKDLYGERPDSRSKNPKILYCSRHQYHPCKYQPKDNNLIHKELKKDESKPASRKNKRMCDCAAKIFEVARWFDCEHYQCKQSVDTYNFCLSCGNGMRVR